MSNEYKYLGDFSAAAIGMGSRHVECHDCKISFTGCWDTFACPQCGQGDYPSGESESAGGK